MNKTSLKNAFNATLLSLPLALSFQAQAGSDTVLKPKVNGRVFEIHCDRDFPNGRPSYELVQRLEKHLGHGAHGGAAKNFNKKLIVNNFLNHHKKITQTLLKPAARRCEI